MTTSNKRILIQEGHSGLAKTISENLKLLGLSIEFIDEVSQIENTRTTYPLLPNWDCGINVYQPGKLIQVQRGKWTVNSVYSIHVAKNRKIPKSLLYGSKRRAKKRFNTMYWTVCSLTENTFMYGTPNWGVPLYEQAESRRHRPINPVIVKTLFDEGAGIGIKKGFKDEH